MSDHIKFNVVAPVFPVTDVVQSIGYFTEKLGFRVGFEWSDKEGEPLSYGIIIKDDTELHLTKAPKPHRTVAYFFISGVEAYFEQVRAAGGEIAQDLQTFPWGMREFEVRDPDGNGIIFGENVEKQE